MEKKIYDPPIAVRVPMDTWEYIHDLSLRRAEPMSKFLRVAVSEYVDKCRLVENKLKGMTNAK